MDIGYIYGGFCGRERDKTWLLRAGVGQNNIWRVHLQKQITQFLTILRNHVFSLCIPINLNQTTVGLFLLD